MTHKQKHEGSKGLKSILEKNILGIGNSKTKVKSKSVC